MSFIFYKHKKGQDVSTLTLAGVKERRHTIKFSVIYIYIHFAANYFIQKRKPGCIFPEKPIAPIPGGKTRLAGRKKQPTACLKTAASP